MAVRPIPGSTAVDRGVGSRIADFATRSAGDCVPYSRSALVGEWARETRCDEIVARLTEAGLEASVLDTAAAFVPGAASGADIKNPQRRDALSRFGTPTSSPPTASSDLGTRTATRSMTAGIA